MSTASDAPVTVNPRWRGWLHVAMFPVALIGGLILTLISRPGPARTASLVFTISAVLLFGVSAVYHRGTWGPKMDGLLRRIDHSNIYLIIAGTYTPFALLAMPERTGRAILAVVWFGALGGVLLKTSWITAPRWLSVPLYLGLGWVAVFVLPSLLQHGGVAAFVLILAGGLLYSFGGIVYGLKRPDPWPRTFGYHEVFHLCTVVAATCHMVAVWLAVY